MSPTSPHMPAGWRTEPPVSLPRAMVTQPAATAAALPLLLPPGVREASHGFRVGPKNECSPLPPMANSSRFALATTMAPAPSSFCKAVAVYGLR